MVAVEQPHEGLARDPVALVLKSVHFLQNRGKLLRLFEVLDGLLELSAGGGKTGTKLLGGVGYRRRAVEVDLVGDLLRQVDDPVERVRQMKYVPRLYRSRERQVCEVVDLARDVVALVLEVAKAFVRAGAVVERAAQLVKGKTDQSCLLFEQLVEARLARDQAKPQALTPPLG